MPRLVGQPFATHVLERKQDIRTVQGSFVDRDEPRRRPTYILKRGATAVSPPAALAPAWQQKIAITWVIVQRALEFSVVDQGIRLTGGVALADHATRDKERLDGQQES
jgi:hypothetical protein